MFRKLPPLIQGMAVGLFALVLLFSFKRGDEKRPQLRGDAREPQVQIVAEPTSRNRPSVIATKPVDVLLSEEIIDPNYPDRPEYQAALRKYYELGLDKKVLPGGGRISPPRPFARPKTSIPNL